MNIIEKLIKEKCGFITTKEELLEIIAINPYEEVLIRANLNRVVVPACQVVTVCKKIDAQENNHVRDCSVGFTRM
jgi:hypothetical protein